MSSEIEPPGLDINWSTSSQVKSLAILSVFLLLYVFGWATGFINPVVAVLGVITFSAIIGAGGWTLWRTRQLTWVLRLDPAGVTVRDSRCTPWSDIAEVRVSALRPRWLFWAWRRRLPVVSFVPHPGIEVASIRGVGQPSFRWQRTLGHKLYDTDLAVLTSATTADVDDILTAVRQFSDGTPIEDRLA